MHHKASAAVTVWRPKTRCPHMKDRDMIFVQECSVWYLLVSDGRLLGFNM